MKPGQIQTKQCGNTSAARYGTENVTLQQQQSLCPFSDRQESTDRCLTRLSVSPAQRCNERLIPVSVWPRPLRLRCQNVQRLVNDDEHVQDSEC